MTTKKNSEAYNKTRESWLTIRDSIDRYHRMGHKQINSIFLDKLITGYEKATEKYNLPPLKNEDNEP